MTRHLFFASLLLPCLSGMAMAGCLDVMITAQGREGTVLVGVYGTKQNFPKPGEHLVASKASLANGFATMRFTDVPAGRYALAAGIDENNNGKVDVNFFGIPREPVAFSKGAEASLFGPPAFDDAALDVPAERVCATAEIRFK
jgi:uncharacterized protein (DUF2141 family)